ncbi:hypothetical protein Pelo_12170 [Pelomyxa schiedti]|nr:hypothetical protein Pelo_12170 [Pelomyxa schiedti]
MVDIDQDLLDALEEMDKEEAQGDGNAPVAGCVNAGEVPQLCGSATTCTANLGVKRRAVVTLEECEGATQKATRERLTEMLVWLVRHPEEIHKSVYLRERVRRNVQKETVIWGFIWLAVTFVALARALTCSGRGISRSVELNYGTSMESFCSICCGRILTINVIVPYLAGVTVLYTLYINSQMHLLNYREPGYISVAVKMLFQTALSILCIPLVVCPIRSLGMLVLSGTGNLSCRAQPVIPVLSPIVCGCTLIFGTNYMAIIATIHAAFTFCWNCATLCRNHHFWLLALILSLLIPLTPTSFAIPTSHGSCGYGAFFFLASYLIHFLQFL